MARGQAARVRRQTISPTSSSLSFPPPLPPSSPSFPTTSVREGLCLEYVQEDFLVHRLWGSEREYVHETFFLGGFTVVVRLPGGRLHSLVHGVRLNGVVLLLDFDITFITLKIIIVEIGILVIVLDVRVSAQFPR